MLKKIFNLFRKKIETPATNTAGVIRSDNPELDSKFWKLLHDDDLTPEEEDRLTKEIDDEFTIRLVTTEGEVLTKAKAIALRRQYRECVKLCHPDKFLEADQAIATHWFNRVEELNRAKNLDQLRKVYSALNFYRAMGTFPHPSNTEFFN
jgi:hypothetical protein